MSTTKALLKSAMILYGGTKEQVLEQLDCQHDWHGPCIDNISRYFKCIICFCIDRDCATKEEYYKRVREVGQSDTK